MTSLAKKDLTENREQRMPFPYFKFSSIISEKVFFLASESSACDFISRHLRCPKSRGLGLVFIDSRIVFEQRPEERYATDWHVSIDMQPTAPIRNPVRGRTGSPDKQWLCAGVLSLPSPSPEEEKTVEFVSTGKKVVFLCK